MSCIFEPNFEAISHVTSVLEPENRPKVWHKKRSHSKTLFRYGKKCSIWL